MSPVGGSRHYAGAGLGPINLWGCPSCGEDNTGPLAQGCVHCGAGVPRAVTPPPATPPPPAAAAPQDDSLVATWVHAHPDATIADAFAAGYLAGVRAGGQQMLAELQASQQAAAAQQGPRPQVAMGDAKTYRTVVAALAIFRDQILASQPEEVATGEWLSAEETTRVIDQLQQLLGREAAHV